MHKIARKGLLYVLIYAGKAMDLLLILGALLGIFLLHSFLKTKSNKKNGAAAARYPPEPAGRLPIIGHLRILAKKEGLLATLGALAEKHGSIFGVSIGSNRTVVVNGIELVKECLTTHDKILATRPNSATGKYLAPNYSIFGLTHYGPYLLKIKKIATQELLSVRQLELSKHVRTLEVNLAIKHLYEQWADSGGAAPVLVEMKQWFEELMFNSVVMSIAGKRYFGPNIAAEEQEEAKRFRSATHQVLERMGVLIVSDAIPFLEWLDLGGHIAATKKTAKELDYVLTLWLEEHRSRAPDKVKDQLDFIDIMLSIVEEGTNVYGHDGDTVIKATALTLVVGGTDTTTITLTWALALLLNHPYVLAKAREELDATIGKDRNVEESDLKNLPYLRAIIKETLRLYPPGPLLIPHEAMDDCSIGGYDIPAGTRVIFNQWKIQRDPCVWRDPLEFLPERFLSSEADQVDVRGKNFELIPFGSGRRICPGISFTLLALHLTLARLLHGFEMTTPDGGPTDMSAKVGFTLSKITPLEILLTPRLSSNLY